MRVQTAVHEGVGNTDACIDGERVDCARIFDAPRQLFDAVAGGQVDPHRDHASAVLRQLALRREDRFVVGRHDDIEAVLGELVGQGEADAARRTRHHRNLHVVARSARHCAPRPHVDPSRSGARASIDETPRRRGGSRTAAEPSTQAATGVRAPPASLLRPVQRVRQRTRPRPPFDGVRELSEEPRPHRHDNGQKHPARAEDEHVRDHSHRGRGATRVLQSVASWASRATCGG